MVRTFGEVILAELFLALCTRHDTNPVLLRGSIRPDLVRCSATLIVSCPGRPSWLCPEGSDVGVAEVAVWEMYLPPSQWSRYHACCRE